jgi:short-subunit dehydrogenase
MTSQFKEKYGSWAFITGGTSGIGDAFANLIAKQGVNIVLVARTKKSLDQQAASIMSKYKVEVKTVQADLSSSEEYKKLIEETKQLKVGLFIPCAGIENHRITTTIPLEKELALIQLNVTSTFVLTHHYAQKMVERGQGGILLVASLIGHMPNPYFSNYAGSKAYVVNFGTSLHWEMKKKGVDVTVLSPGVTDTPMSKSEDIDWSKAPFSIMSPKATAELGLKGLGKKPLVIPGTKNRIMMFMTTRLTPLKMAILVGGKMTERVMPSVLR